MINFASDRGPRRAGRRRSRRLPAGKFDWLVVTSATTVDVLISQRRRRSAATTRIAGGRRDHGRGAPARRLPRGLRAGPSDNAAAWCKLSCAEGASRSPAAGAHPAVRHRRADAGRRRLAEVGLDVEFVDRVPDGGRAGRAGASPRTCAHGSHPRGASWSPRAASPARSQPQLGPMPAYTVVAASDPRTAFDARAAGLPVHVIADSSTACRRLGAGRSRPAAEPTPHGHRRRTADLGATSPPQTEGIAE